MSRLDFSSAHKEVEIGAGADFRDGNTFPDGMAGIYPYDNGTIDYTDSRGQSFTGVPVFAGIIPNIRGKVNITGNTVKLLIGLN